MKIFVPKLFDELIFFVVSGIQFSQYLLQLERPESFGLKDWLIKETRMILRIWEGKEGFRFAIYSRHVSTLKLGILVSYSRFSKPLIEAKIILRIINYDKRVR